MNVYAAGPVMRRREEIVAIIRQTAVHSQEELMAILRRRRFRVTQPTLSRDLRELGLVKTPGGYVAPDDLAAAPARVISFTPKERREERLDQLIREFVITAEVAGNLVVIRTPPADAQPVASALDGAALEDVLGTIAGDDTIFVALRHASSAAALARRVHELATPARSTRS